MHLSRIAAKNVILAGVRGVTVHDTAKVALTDLSAQFYLTEQVGRGGGGGGRSCTFSAVTTTQVAANACTKLVCVPATLPLPVAP